MGIIAKKLGEKIKEIRKKRNLTQLKLAELLNMETSNLSKIERGIQIPKEDSLIKLAEVLNVSPRELFNFEFTEDKSLIIKNINNILTQADLSTVQKYYKVLISLV